MALLQLGELLGMERDVELAAVAAVRAPGDAGAAGAEALDLQPDVGGGLQRPVQPPESAWKM